MTDEEIFDLADQYGWMDDFGRWNFQPDRLVSFALAMSEKNVRVSDKNRLIRIMGTFDLATGHADTMDQALDALESELRDVLGHLRARREWVGLTDEEIKALPSWWPSYDQMPALMTLARDIENSLKEKNT